MERIELIGDQGGVILESDGRLRLTRLEEPLNDFIRNRPAGFSTPQTRTEILTPSAEGDLSAGVTRDFVQAIRTGRPLLVPGAEGIASLQLANAMLLSTWTDAWVPLPFDEDRFETELRARQQNSHLRETAPATVMRLEDSFVGGR